MYFLKPTDVLRGRSGRDRMVVGFTTTFAISVYHHSSAIKTDRDEITEILSKVAINTITLIPNPNSCLKK